ncbi:MAG: MMPL family transporter [Treponema sp.]|jgi:predicted RND superfamily exporter protein|nr:MMPL family transporter [Treponema sp.]
MEKLYKYPVLIAVLIAAITVFFAVQLPKVRLDNNNMRFLPNGNQARNISEYIDEEFGGQVVIFVGLECPYNTVFDPAFLARVKDFSDAVKEIEVVKDVNSIMSTKYITGNSDSIIIDDLVPENFSGADVEIAELKRRIASWELFQGAIVSNDHQATQVLITLNVTTEEQTSAEVNSALVTIRNIARETFAGFAEVYITGLPVINATINEAMIADNIILIPLVLVALLAVLFFSFRRFTFVILPLITVIIAVTWTTGAMAFLGVPLSILTTVLPVILVAVGSAYGIHVVTHYIEDCRERTLTADDHRTLVFQLMRKMLKPVFLTAITTCAGFISFCFTPIVPMREFGICAGTGVITSFVVTVTLIPALLLIRGAKQIKTAAHANTGTDRFSNFISNTFLTIAKKKGAILCVTALVIAFSLYGLSKIIVDNVLLEFFQNETDISRSDRFIREHFGGSKDLTVVVKADSSDVLLSPVTLLAVDNLSAYLSERLPETGKVVGFTDIIKRINQVFNVDESPEGLAMVKETRTANMSDDSFGFGFGFSDSLGFANVTSETTVSAPVAQTTDYSVNDLFALLDTAAGNNAAMSGNDLVKELKRLINYDGFSYYEVPSDPARYGKLTDDELQRLVSNYLVLLSGDDSIVYSNDPFEPTAIKTTIQLRTTGNRDTIRVIKKINAYIDANFPKNIEVMIGGGATLEGAVTELIISSQVISIVASILIVFLIITVSYRSFSAGIIGALPLAIAILCNFAVMGFLGVKLNIGTALVAGLAFSIGTDYAIHFIEAFKREYRAGSQNTDDCLRLTFIGCGKAIIINAVSVSAGFAVLALSQFRIVAEMGALIAFSMIITALVSLTIIPALLTVIKPKFIFNGGKI